MNFLNNKKINYREKPRHIRTNCFNQQDSSLFFIVNKYQKRLSEIIYEGIHLPT